MTIGSGAHTYEWVGDWAKLPAGVEFGYTHGVEIDDDHNVYLFNTGEHPVCVFDSEGTFKTSWGEQWRGSAHGMYLSRENGESFFYLSDNVNATVTKTTLDGEKVWEIGTPDVPEAYDDEHPYKPTDAAVAPDGSVYVCDGYGQSWVHQYTNDGRRRVRSWGGVGAGRGKLRCPHGIWVDTRNGDPEILVADRSNRRIQVFDLDGTHDRFIEGDVRYPCCFYQWQDEIYIPDLHSRVTILDGDNELITHLGDTPGRWEEKGWPNLDKDSFAEGQFSSPHGLAVDTNGDIYVAEWVAWGRVTKLVRK